MLVQYIGHATVIADMGKYQFITDPFLRPRLAVVKKRFSPLPNLDLLPKVDFILISHAHLDHLDMKSLANFPKDIPIITAENIDRILEPAGFTNVVSLSWGQSYHMNDLRVTATSAKHVKGRVLDLRTKYCSFIVESNRQTLFFGGDSAYFDGYKEIGHRFKIDVACLPIGAFAPRRVLHESH